MTTGRKDVVFVMFGSRVVPWNVINGKVLMNNLPGARKDFSEKGVVVEEKKLTGPAGEQVNALAVAVEALDVIFEMGVLVRGGDPLWEGLWKKHGLVNRRGHGEYEEGKWSWGGVDFKKE